MFSENANMIVFELICPDRHRFEGWFASSEDFESQKSRGLLSCPVCSGSSIQKLLTAKIGKPEAEPAGEKADPTPALTAKIGKPEAEPAGEKADPTPALAAVPGNPSELIDYVLLNTENVGENFPAEARRIHHKEVAQRNIRGLATGEETRELLEEGIAVMPLPVPPRKDWH